MRAVRWCFDVEDVVRDGFTDGTTWNGFDNIWIDAKTFAELASDEDTHPEFYDIVANSYNEATGLYSLAYGCSTVIREE